MNFLYAPYSLEGLVETAQLLDLCRKLAQNVVHDERIRLSALEASRLGHWGRVLRVSADELEEASKELDQAFANGKVQIEDLLKTGKYDQALHPQNSGVDAQSLAERIHKELSTAESAHVVRFLRKVCADVKDAYRLLFKSFLFTIEEGPSARSIARCLALTTSFDTARHLPQEGFPQAKA